MLDKSNNEKFVLEGMLYEFKIKYAEIQNEIEKYRDQNTSLRRKIDVKILLIVKESNDTINKKEETIRKFVLSKEKIPLLDNKNVYIPNASRLDLTIALTDNPNLNSAQINNLFTSNNSKPELKKINKSKFDVKTNYLSSSPSDMSFCNINSMKSNYNSVSTYNSNVTLVSTPNNNLIIEAAKNHNNNGSFFKKIRNLLFADNK